MIVIELKAKKLGKMDEGQSVVDKVKVKGRSRSDVGKE